MKQNIMTRLSLAGVGSLALSLVCTQVQAATIQFDNRVAFENATTSLNIETFNSFTSDVTLPSVADPADGLDIGAFFLSQSPGGRTFFDRINLDGSDFFNVDGTSFVEGIGGNPGESITFLFKESITAFGVDLFSVNNDEKRTEVIIDSETFTPPITSGHTKTFFGVTSDTPFTTVTFSTTQTVSDFAGLDNVSFGVAQSDTAAVPESGFTVALLALGTLGLFKVRSKK